jgi:uncharacterized protein YdhG (YjbR/CyaY superfamily)
VVDDAVRGYVDAIPEDHRPLFDRVSGLIARAVPEAEVGISYGIPTYRVGKRRLFVGVWKHGVSLYGWQEGSDAGFVERHPQLRTGEGTIRLRAQDAAAIDDAELRDLARAVLGGEG